MRKIRECVGRLHNLCHIRTRGTRIGHIRSDRGQDGLLTIDRQRHRHAAFSRYFMDQSYEVGRKQVAKFMARISLV